MKHIVFSVEFWVILCQILRLLTGCTTFEEALDLADKGDNKNVDKLVKVMIWHPFSNINSLSIGLSLSSLISETTQTIEEKILGNIFSQWTC